MKNKLHILKSELPEDGQQLRPKDVGGLTNKSFVQQVGVKFYIRLTEVYVIKDNINAFNKTLNKPSKADSAAMLDPRYALLPEKVYAVFIRNNYNISLVSIVEVKKNLIIAAAGRCIVSEIPNFNSIKKSTLKGISLRLPHP